VFLSYDLTHTFIILLFSAGASSGVLNHTGFANKNALNRGNKTIKIPKLGEVKYRRHNKINDFFTAKGALLKSITVRKNPAGEYYAVLLYQCEYCRKPKQYSGDENKTTGLDFSPGEFYINSSGDSGKDFGYVAQKQFHKKQLKKLQRQLMKKKKAVTTKKRQELKLLVWKTKL
jgi:putative transposase